MTHGVRPMSFTYKGRSIILDQPGWYCDRCDEGIHTGTDMMATEPAFREFMASVDGLLPSPEIARIRRKLNLSQRLAGEILGGGPRAFQEYEKGTDVPNKAMSNLLRLLDTDPSRLAELTGTPDARTLRPRGRRPRRPQLDAAPLRRRA
jgi:HTH-type transcriptional regulator/antitoxin MqsA